MISLAIHFTSPIGPITITRSLDGINRVQIGAGVLETQNMLADELLLQARNQVQDYLAGSRKSFTLPLDWQSVNGFSASVLKNTLEIQYGEVRTYGQLARQLGNPNASRAVGRAMATNPLPILIPCHRVVGAGGRLTGYTGANGIATKKWLLELEGHRVVAQKLA